MEIFKGPLGSHKNYINFIALENFKEYDNLSRHNREINNNKTPNKYVELRHFLNAAESMNNILDYLFYEHEEEISFKNLRGYKQAVLGKYPELKKLADLANAYKHCKRENQDGKNEELPWAKDLQRPELDVKVSITSEDGVDSAVKYNFQWPIAEHEDTLRAAFVFWVSYTQPDGCDLINL